MKSMASTAPLGQLARRVLSVSTSTALCQDGKQVLPFTCRYASTASSNSVRLKGGSWYSDSTDKVKTVDKTSSTRKSSKRATSKSSSSSSSPSSSSSSSSPSPIASSSTPPVSTATAGRGKKLVVMLTTDKPTSTASYGSNTTTSYGSNTTEPSQRESDRDILRLKLDLDNSRPITLNRLELLMNHPSIAPHQIMQLVDLGRSAGINSSALYSHALHALSRLPTWTRPARYMERVFTIMAQDNIQLSTKDYTSNIRQLCKNSRVDKAEEVLATMAAQGVSPSTAAFNLLLQARAKLGHLDKCMSLYGMMKERGVAASTNTLIILMEGFCAFGGLHYAIQMFEKFKEDGYTPSTLVCNLLMKQIVDLGSLTQMEFFFTQMAKSEAIRPDLETYSFVYQAYKKANMKEKQDEVRLLMQSDAFIPDLEELGAKLINLGKAGYGDKCETLTAYSNMIKDGVQPNMDTLQAMLSIYFKNRDWTNVMDTYTNILCFSLRPHLRFDSVPQISNYNKNITTPEDQATDIPVSVYSIMLSCYLETGKYQQAKQMISELEAGGIEIDGSVYASFITTLGFGGEKKSGGEGEAEGEGVKTEAVEEVLQMVEHMKLRGHEPDAGTYRQLINNLINLHQPDKAFQLLTSLVNSNMMDKEGLSDLFSPLVRAYCSNEDATHALQVVQLMKSVGLVPNELLVLALVFCLVRCQLPDRARDIVKWAKDHGHRTDSAEEVIQTAVNKAKLAK